MMIGSHLVRGTARTDVIEGSDIYHLTAAVVSRLILVLSACDTSYVRYARA